LAKEAGAIPSVDPPHQGQVILCKTDRRIRRFVAIHKDSEKKTQKFKMLVMNFVNSCICHNYHKGEYYISVILSLAYSHITVIKRVSLKLLEG
jgi:hypothetical protein